MFAVERPVNIKDNPPQKQNIDYVELPENDSRHNFPKGVCF
jgi:hypothetical protein